MNSLSLFISYSHQDERFRKELNNHLSPLQRTGFIEAWHDRCILPGSKWAAEIDQRIEEADLILPLVSADFIASDYCYEKEMGRALERHEAGDATVIPVVIRSVVWESTPLAKLQALPRDARPVEEWKYRDRAWADVARGVLEASKGIFDSSNAVKAMSGESRAMLNLSPETTAEVDVLDEDEIQTENLMNKWQDTRRIGIQFPELASRLAEYRRDKEALESLRPKLEAEIMSLHTSSLPIEVITFLTMLSLKKHQEGWINFRMKEMEVLQALDDAKINQDVTSLRYQLDPKDLGLMVTSIADAGRLLASQMEEYANTVKGAEEVAKLVKKEVLEPLKKLEE